MSGVKGRSGRRKDPTEFKVLKGTARADRMNPDEPKPDLLEEAPAPPCPLDRVARKEWDRIAPLLIRLRLLSAIDLAALAGYCRAFADCVAARRHIERHGRYQKTPDGGFKLNPAVRDAHRAAELVRGYLVEFGMSPSSRSRVVTGGGGAPANPNGKGQETPRPRAITRLGNAV
jgi:P27 family predicted phage terminase small subunit